MPESTALQANFKSPAGTLINIYADNGGEFGELLDALPEFLGKVTAVEQLLFAAGAVGTTIPVAPPAQQPTAQSGQAVPTQQFPSDAPAAAPEGVHLCDHGQPMKLIPAGISKASGKPYKAFYACQQPRGMQCEKKVWL